MTIPVIKEPSTQMQNTDRWQVRNATVTRVIESEAGTMVAVQYGGRELSVPVIDRGPFADHASRDVTMATARLLGVRATSTLGALAPAPPALLAAAYAHTAVGHANGIAPASVR